MVLLYIVLKKKQRLHRRKEPELVLLLEIMHCARATYKLATVNPLLSPPFSEEEKLISPPFPSPNPYSSQKKLTWTDML